MKLFFWVFAAILIAVAVLFALSNRQAVELGLWPVPFVLDVPAYGLGLVAFAAGFLCGGFVVWLRAVASRMRAREAARRADRLQNEVDALRAQIEEGEKKAAPDGAVAAISDASPPFQKIAGGR